MAKTADGTRIIKRLRLSRGSAAFFFTGMLLLVVLFMWHALDVYAGTGGSGDGFLIRNYLLLGAFLFCACSTLLYSLLTIKARLAVVYAAALLVLGSAGIFVFKGRYCTLARTY